jgi:hypothetical protein
VNYANTGNYMPTSRGRWELKEELDCGEFAVPTQSAKDAYATCLKYSGCSLTRDAVDERMISNIVAQKGQLIDSQSDVGGWDRYPMERRPNHWDRDRDGDGYTNLEEYLNSLCPNI